MANQDAKDGKKTKSNEELSRENAELLPSLASRIGSSASSLSRDLLSGASSSTSTLASSTAASEKARQATSGPSGSASGESSTWAQSSARPGVYRGTSSSGTTQQQFRSEREETENASSELNKFTERRDQNARPIGLDPNLDYRATSWTGQFRVETEDLRYETLSNINHVNDVAAAQEADGLAVVDLLGDPRLLGDDSMLQTEFEGAEEVSADDLFNEPLSAEQQDIKGKMKATLPAPPEHTPANPRNPRNLIPDADILQLPVGAEERRKIMRQWVEDWDAVLNRYTDEVWGADLPQVQEARKELEDLKKDREKLDDRQAVRRLQMILQHIQVPGTNGSLPP